MIVVIILTTFLITDARQKSEIIAVLSVFGLTSIRALPYMSNLLGSINTLKFSKEAIQFYNKNLNFEPVKNFSTSDKTKNVIERFEFKNINFKYPNMKNNLLKI